MMDILSLYADTVEKCLLRDSISLEDLNSTKQSLASLLQFFKCSSCAHMSASMKVFRACNHVLCSDCAKYGERKDEGCDACRGTVPHKPKQIYLQLYDAVSKLCQALSKATFDTGSSTVLENACNDIKTEIAPVLLITERDSTLAGPSHLRNSTLTSAQATSSSCRSREDSTVRESSSKKDGTSTLLPSKKDSMYSCSHEVIPYGHGVDCDLSLVSSPIKNRLRSIRSSSRPEKTQNKPNTKRRKPLKSQRSLRSSTARNVTPSLGTRSCRNRSSSRPKLRSATRPRPHRRR